MSSTAFDRLGGRSWSWLLGPALVAGAVSAGALFGYSAVVAGPLVLPAAVAFLLLALTAAGRPLVGTVAAFPLLVAGNVGAVPGPPWALGAAWCAFVLALALLTGATAGERLQLPPLFGLLTALFLVAAGAAIAGGTVAESVPVLRSLVTGIVLYLAIVLSVRRDADLAWVLFGITLAAGVVALYAGYQWRFGDPLGVGFLTDTGAIVSRVSAGFGHPNQLGGFLVILCPYVLGAALLQRRARVAYLAAFALVVFGIYVSFSRGSLVALAVVPFFFLRLRHVLALLPLLGVLVLAVAPGLLRERFGTLSGQGSELATRVDIWSTAYRIWLERPLLGVGTGGFPDAYATVRVPGKQFLPATIFQPPPHAHNVELQVLSEQGIIGLAVLVALLAGALFAALRLRRSGDVRLAVIGSATAASLAAFLIHNQFDVTLLETNGIFFLGLLGLVAAAARLAQPLESGRQLAAPELRRAGMWRPFRRDRPRDAGAGTSPREADLEWRERRLAEWQRELVTREQAGQSGPPPPDHRDDELVTTGRLDGLARELAVRAEELDRAAGELARRSDALERRLEAITTRERALARKAVELAVRKAAPTDLSELEPRPPYPVSQRLPSLDELERLVELRHDSARLDEWRYTIMYLRDHADVHGRLPPEFADLIADVFGDLL